MLNCEVILSLISVEVIKDINLIITDIEDMDNNSRADRIKRIMEYYDFKEIGCGTNRIVFTHPEQPNMVFKIALDARGVKDNNLERQLSKVIAHEFVTECYENNGLISMSERIQVMTKYDMKDRKEEVVEVLRQLAPMYILNDVGFREFLNWGIRDGKAVILDYAYLRPITPGMDFTCGYAGCTGKLMYTKNFNKFKCVKCGCKKSLSEIQDEFSNLIEEGLII